MMIKKWALDLDQKVQPMQLHDLGVRAQTPKGLLGRLQLMA